MNGIQGRKAQNIEKHPGCLGRMVNLFDLSSGVPGNRLLTDKPHCDGSSISRSHSDVVRMLGPSFGDPLEDKVIVSELRRTSSNHRTYGTPMKTLIAEEMSKEVESKHNPPNLVARLMGLETLPRQQPNLAARRSHSRGSSWRSLSHSEMPLECWEQDEGFLDKQMQCDVHHCQELNKCKDVYEIWQRSQKTGCLRDNSKQKGRYNDIANERNMALVRQKFMEAKRLATDEKLRESKEFQDALEVLNNNKELFLKLLQEPNSMFSQQLYSLESLPPPPKTKRITVLRPSKTVENDKLPGAGKKSDRLTNKPAQIGQLTGWDRNNPGQPAQPTRIVVLKPSPGRPQDIKTVVFPSLSSPSILHGEAYYEEPEDEDALESREVAREITRQMRDNLGGHRRDEILLSSAFPNGCNGDDSSFNKSEIECAGGNLSDSEVMSPASRHSWDYINRFGSPISSPSFSRASCSSESSVCREAKKRLSERWAMMASNGKSEEHKHVRRSSNTLGEMLALSDTRKPARSAEEEGNKEQELRGSTSIEVDKEESMNDSPKNLPRSKSVPVSSTAFGSMLNVGVSYLEGSKMLGPEEAIKAKPSKSSLKGKVSSFFSSKNKKLSKEKSNASEPNKDDSPSSTPGTPVSPVIYLRKSNRDASQCVSNSSIEECLSPDLGRSGEHTPDLTSIGKKEGIVSREAVLSVANPLMPGHASENLDQPSPISVLDPPFEEDETTIPESSSNIKLEYQGVEELPKSNLIDKSPPIESIARTLSWNDSCAETPTAYSSKPSSSPCGMEEEQDWFFFVQSLLSAAGLDPEVQTDSFIARWHLNESPLDLSLRDKYANLNEKEPVHESKRRQRRSNQKLAFDCVNAALLEITGYGSDSSMRTMSFGRLQSAPTEVAPPKLVDHLWAQMKDWFASNGKCTPVDDGGSIEELVGKGWTDQMKLEMDNVGKEIESKLVEELVEESVVDLTGRVV